jgi:hypothetical protein
VPVPDQNYIDFAFVSTIFLLIFWILLTVPKSHNKYNCQNSSKITQQIQKIVETNAKSISFLVWYRHYILKGGRVTLVKLVLTPS